MLLLMQSSMGLVFIACKGTLLALSLEPPRPFSAELLPTQAVHLPHWIMGLFLSQVLSMHLHFSGFMGLLLAHFSSALGSLWMAHETLWCMNNSAKLCVIQNLASESPEMSRWTWKILWSTMLSWKKIFITTHGSNVYHVPAPCMGIGLGDLFRWLPTQTVLWFYIHCSPLCRVSVNLSQTAVWISWYW